MAQLHAVDPLGQPGKGAAGINLAVSLEKAKKAGATTAVGLGMAIGMAQAAVRRDLSRPVERTAQLLAASLKSRIRLQAPELMWLHLPPLSLFAPASHGAKRLSLLLRAAPPWTIVTNLGAVESTSSRVRPTGNAFAMAPQSGCPLVTAVLGWGGELWITLTWNPELLTDDQAHSVADRMRIMLAP